MVRSQKKKKKVLLLWLSSLSGCFSKPVPKLFFRTRIFFLFHCVHFSSPSKERGCDICIVKQLLGSLLLSENNISISSGIGCKIVVLVIVVSNAFPWAILVSFLWDNRSDSFQIKWTGRCVTVLMCSYRKLYAEWLCILYILVFPEWLCIASLFMTRASLVVWQ